MSKEISQVVIAQTMTTPEIATLCNKRHDNVMRIANILSDKGIIASPQIEDMVNIGNGAMRAKKIYRLNKTESINLVANLSPEFTAAIIDRWQELETTPAKATLPYHMRRYLANRTNVPPHHFSALSELCNWFMLPLEDVGYDIKESMLPDGSFGKTFCAHLRKLGYDTNAFPTYRHAFEDGRVCYPKAYPDELLGVAKGFFFDHWLPQYAPSYYLKRDIKALQFIQDAFIPAISYTSTSLIH